MDIFFGYCAEHDEFLTLVDNDLACPGREGLCSDSWEIKSVGDKDAVTNITNMVAELHGIANRLNASIRIQ